MQEFFIEYIYYISMYKYMYVIQRTTINQLNQISFLKEGISNQSMCGKSSRETWSLVFIPRSPGLLRRIRMPR